MTGSENCPLCGTSATVSINGSTNTKTDCPRCGTFVITHEAKVNARHLRQQDEIKIAAISHSVRRMAMSNRLPLVTAEILDRLLATAELPTPVEQMDNLILWMGNTQIHPGQFLGYGEANRDSLAAVIGAVNEDGVRFLIGALREAGLCSFFESVDQILQLKLSISGWQRYQDLKRGHTASRTAFMALKFGQAVLDRMVEDHFRPAVAAAGFTLRRADDNPRAGLIDDQIRVDIRNARFVIADLTHGSHGAYWEAGYAEGLGKPVIYTCDKSVFEDEEAQPHFDTNHHVTVLWTEDDPADFVRRLKATIRATIPDAKQESGA